MGIIPQIKKDIESFILDEKGGISKQALISFGVLLAGIETMALLSKLVAGANISALHDHCDPGHGSGGNAHSSADGVPASHCSGHTNYGGWGVGGGVNVEHANNIVLDYG